MKPNQTKRAGFRLPVLLLLLAVLLCGCVFPGGAPASGSSGTAGGAGETTGTAPTVGPDSAFEVHFIDVGQGDCTLILCDGRSMLIDGGDKSASRVVYTYLKKLELTELDYVVCTHPDADHVGGLSGALEYAKAGTVYCPVDSYDSQAFGNFRDRVTEQGKALTRPVADTVFRLGSATVTVLAPREDYSDNNNQSIVLRVVYGETSFLFTGDAEYDSERAMCEAGVTLQSTVLKVGHHGSDTSTSIRFLGEVMPTYAVISCGTGNKYGHPTEQTLSRLAQAGVTVYRTDLQGDIICTSDGKTVSFRTQKNSDATAEPESDSAAVTEYPFVGNLNTKKFHRTDCRYVPAQENAIWFTSYEEAVEKGYTPCGVCKPESGN